MATPTQPPPPGSSSTSLSPLPSTTGLDPTRPGKLPPISLCLYVFSILLALLVTILGALVTRSVRRRRLRNAALASGTYVYESNGAESKPVLWETLITSVSDGEKGWPGLLPVAGVTPVPAHDAMSQHPASRQPPLGTHRLVAHDLPPSIPSRESPASSSIPISLTVLVSMPTPPANGKAIQGNRGIPTIELGVAQVTYPPNVL